MFSSQNMKQKHLGQLFLHNDIRSLKIDLEYIFPKLVSVIFCSSYYVNVCPSVHFSDQFGLISYSVL